MDGLAGTQTRLERSEYAQSVRQPQPRRTGRSCRLSLCPEKNKNFIVHSRDQRQTGCSQTPARHHAAIRPHRARVRFCTRPRARLGPRAAHMAPPRRVTTSAPGERSSIHAQLARTNQTNTSTFRPARRLRRLDSPNLIHGTRGSTGQHLQTDKARTGANLHRNCTMTSTACMHESCTTTVVNAYS